MLHKRLTSSAVNTKDGSQAKVFHIPVYLGRYFNAAWQKYSDPSDAWMINKECHGQDSVACWAEKWIVAENVCLEPLLSAYKATACSGRRQCCSVLIDLASAKAENSTRVVVTSITGDKYAQLPGSSGLQC